MGSLVSSVRSTILQLEQNIPTAFMHTNWAMLRRPWMSAVQNSSNPGKDFSRALTVLLCCIKPCILLPVWTDSLGHTNIKRIQAQAKEEKKKVDKKEKKEREDEEERLKPWLTWVKYTLPVKSLSVVRQKGEEYRAHGRNGWLWLSSTRVFKPKDSSKMGLKAGAHRIAVKYTELKSNTNKVVLMEPKAFAFLMKVQKERDDKALARMVSGEEEVEEEDTGKEKTEEEKKKAQEEVDKVIREEEESRRKMEEDAKQEELDKRKKLREDRMEARMNKRGDIFQDSGLFDGVDEDPILEEVATSEETVDSSGNNTTVSEETVAEEVVTSADEVIPSSGSLSTSKPMPVSSQPIIIQKPDIPLGNYFKLGQEGTYKQYENQYTAVSYALSSPDSRASSPARAKSKSSQKKSGKTPKSLKGSKAGTPGGSRASSVS